MKFTFLLIIITLIIVGCASQKNLDITPEKIYTSDNTVVVEDEIITDNNSEVLETKIHIVQKGESLWVIAKKYGLSVQDIAKANNIENTSLIKINQELIIPDKKNE